MTIAPFGLPDLKILRIKTEELFKTKLPTEDDGMKGGKDTVSDDR
jgi:hypothetical protein